MSNRTYGLYALLDTRKPGCYKYYLDGSIEIEFEYEPFYIGYSYDPTSRALSHIHEANAGKDNYNSHKSNKIRAVVRETGSNPEFEIVFSEVDSIEEAKSLEVKLIKVIGRYDLGTGPLTNKTAGGDGLVNYIFTESHIANLSGPRPSIQGENNPFYGCTHSKDTRKKMSDAVNKAYENPEYYEKLRQMRIGVPHSEEHCNNISNGLSRFHEWKLTQQDISIILHTKFDFIFKVCSEYPEVFDVGVTLNKDKIIFGKSEFRTLRRIQDATKDNFFTIHKRPARNVSATVTIRITPEMKLYQIKTMLSNAAQN